MRNCVLKAQIGTNEADGEAMPPGDCSAVDPRILQFYPFGGGVGQPGDWWVAEPWAFWVGVLMPQRQRFVTPEGPGLHNCRLLACARRAGALPGDGHGGLGPHMVRAPAV